MWKMGILDFFFNVTTQSMSQSLRTSDTKIFHKEKQCKPLIIINLKDKSTKSTGMENTEKNEQTFKNFSLFLFSSSRWIFNNLQLKWEYKSAPSSLVWIPTWISYFFQIKLNLLFPMSFLCTNYKANSSNKSGETDFNSNIKAFYTWVTELNTQFKSPQKCHAWTAGQKYTLKR